MLIRTHLAIAVFAIILFLSRVSNKLLFVLLVLSATFIPDIDNAFSTVGSKGVFRVLQFFTRHRGFFHSLTFCILASIVLGIFFPVIAFPFFLGYALHLFADSFTKEGVVPFWPWSRTSQGFLRTGGRVETSIFVVFIIIDILLFVFIYFI